MQVLTQPDFPIILNYLYWFTLVLPNKAVSPESRDQALISHASPGLSPLSDM